MTFITRLLISVVLIHHKYLKQIKILFEVYAKLTKITLTLMKQSQNMIHSKTCQHQYVHHCLVQLKEALLFLIEKQMAPGLPNLSIRYKIYLTLPVTSANAERSFSKLKIIKSCLHSTMTNERLSSLGLISIERDLAENIDFESTINRFALMKLRSKQFK